MIKTIFIDVDDTIFDFGAGQKTALFETFDKLNYYIDESIYSLYDSINISYWKKFERGETTKDKLIIDRFVTLFNETGIKGDPYRTEDIYRKFLDEQAVWWDGAEDGVKYLSEKYDLYATTNGCGATQIKRIRKAGLDKYLKDTFISEIIGYPKPRKEYYEYCFNRSGAEKESTLAMGDSLTSDIAGGINAGLKTLWCNFKSLPVPDMKIDYVAYNWNDIKNIL